MALFHLEPHPDTPSKSGFQVYAFAKRWNPLELVLTFSIRDSVPKIAWYEPTQEGRYDELWKHSCFEAFVQPVARDDYVELNFAPEKRWALYDLDGYRSGLRNSAEAALRDMRFTSQEQLSYAVCSMRVTLDLPPSFADVPWNVGLSTIIEETDGTKSYWALAHAPGPPDFHNADCFIATLPAPAAP